MPDLGDGKSDRFVREVIAQVAAIRVNLASHRELRYFRRQSDGPTTPWSAHPVGGDFLVRRPTFRFPNVLFVERRNMTLETIDWVVIAGYFALLSWAWPGG